MPLLTTLAAPALSRPNRGALNGLLRALRLARSRRDLSGLSAEQLKDVGLTRQQAEAEARRPLWDAPAHWRG